MPAIRSTFSLVVFALLTAGLPACGNDIVGPHGDQSEEVLSGSWAFTSNLSVSDYGVTADSDADLQIRHAEGQSTITGTYTGSATWTGPGGTITEQTSGGIQGSYSGNRVSFTDDGGCVFEGSASTGSGRMQGTVKCPDYEGSDVSGSWTATRKN